MICTFGEVNGLDNTSCRSLKSGNFKESSVERVPILPIYQCTAVVMLKPSLSKAEQFKSSLERELKIPGLKYLRNSPKNILFSTLFHFRRNHKSMKEIGLDPIIQISLTTFSQFPKIINLQNSILSFLVIKLGQFHESPI